MRFQIFLTAVTIDKSPEYRVAPRLIMNDGFEISIQASNSHYCTPRKPLVNYDEFTEFELGFPSEPDPLISGFAEEPSDETESIYPLVPSLVIQQLVSKHGGIAGFHHNGVKYI